jgi:hypothetical protein
LLDFGCGKDLGEDGVVRDLSEGSSVWYAPESYNKIEYTYNADVYHIGNEFSVMASYDGENRANPWATLYDGNIHEDGPEVRN